MSNLSRKQLQDVSQVLANFEGAFKSAGVTEAGFANVTRAKGFFWEAASAKGDKRSSLISRGGVALIRAIGDMGPAATPKVFNLLCKLETVYHQVNDARHAA